MSESAVLPFHFIPRKEDKVVKGVLISPGLSLSLSFEGGTDLVFNQHVAHSPLSFDIPPDKNIIPLNKALDGKIVRGTVGINQFDSGDFVLGSVYFIIEQEKEEK